MSGAAPVTRASAVAASRWVRWSFALQPLLALFALGALVQTILYAWMTLPALASHGGASRESVWVVGWAAALFAIAAMLFALGLSLPALLSSAPSVAPASLRSGDTSRLSGLRNLLAPVSLLASILAALLVVLVSLDCMIFTVLGVRMDDYFVLSALNRGQFMREAHFGVSTYLSVVLAVLVALVAHLFLLRWLRRVSETGARWPLRAAVLVLGLLFIVGTSISLSRLSSARSASDPALAALPLGSTLLSSSDEVGHITVRYPPPASRLPRKLGVKRNIAMILVESLRGDFATPELMPKMNAMAAQPGCVKGLHHYSGGHATAWGVFSFLYGLNSYNFLPFHKYGLPSVPLKLLQEQGYELVGVSASSLRGWDHSDFVLDNFDTYREFAHDKGWRNDRKMFEWIKRWAKERDQSRPFALFVFVLSPHHNYYYPPEFEIYKPVMPENYNHFMNVDKLRVYRDRIVNRYKNSVRWVDHLLRDILDVLEAQGELELAIGGDHGEEFWDHGLLGHGASRLYNERTRVPLFLCVPGADLHPPALSSHVDVWPTLIDALRPDPPLPPAQWSDGVSLLRPLPPDRFVVVTGVGFPYAGKLIALLHLGYKLWLERDGALTHFKVVKRLSLDDRELPSKPLPGEGLWLRRLAVQMHRFLRTERAVSRQTPAVQHPIGAQLGPWLKLVGYDLELRDPRPGGTVVVRWVFECLQPIPKQWHLFVHLAPGDKKNYRNLDHVPVDGTLPLSRFAVGDFVRDEQVLELPETARVGAPLPLTLGLWAPGAGRAEIIPGPGGEPIQKRALRAALIPLSAPSK